jgi:hypothetical protein
MRPQVVSEEPSYSSSIGKSPSRFGEEEKKQHSPLRESRGFSETQGSHLSVPGGSSSYKGASPYKSGASPSRYDVRDTHASPIRSKTDVSRDLYSRSSAQKSPTRY